MKKLLKGLVVFLYRIMNCIFPVKENTIVISSSLGRSYSGNPKAIYETIVEKGYDREKLNIIWFYDIEKHNIPGKHRQVRFRSFLYLYYMAVAGKWIFDARQPGFLRKRDKVVYLQTWHGTPLKKLGLDLDEVFMSGEDSIEKYKEEFSKNAATWDILISQNEYSSEIFRRAFAFNGTMLETGYPRNDILFKKDDNELITSLKKRLNLPKDKKIMLYAPTWRDDKINGSGIYKFDTSLDFNLLQERFGDDYVIIVKYHYLVRDDINWSNSYKGFVYLFNESADIADLMVVSDLLITDYSSVMFDYTILRKPMYFFCPDIERYRDVLRGFYFDFEATSPGPLSKDTAELTEQIKEGMDLYEHKYAERYERFVRKYNPWDDGHASERVIEALL